MTHSITINFTSPEGEGFQPSPNRTLKMTKIIRIKSCAVVISGVTLRVILLKNKNIKIQANEK